MKYFLIILAALVFAQANNKCDKGEAPKANKTAANNTMSNEANNQTKFDRLPDGANLTDEVRKDVLNDKGEVVSSKTITVEEELKNLGARYANEELVDRSGREIRFYTPPARGASQGYEQDEMQRKTDEKNLADLKKKYTVIVLYIDPRKAM